MRNILQCYVFTNKHIFSLANPVTRRITNLQSNLDSALNLVVEEIYR